MPTKPSCLVKLTRSSLWPLIFKDKHGTGLNHTSKNIMKNSRTNGQLLYKTSSPAMLDSDITLNKLLGISTLKQQLKEG
jgi:hypothetical protein